MGRVARRVSNLAKLCHIHHFIDNTGEFRLSGGLWRWPPSQRAEAAKAAKEMTPRKAAVVTTKETRRSVGFLVFHPFATLFDTF